MAQVIAVVQIQPLELSNAVGSAKKKKKKKKRKSLTWQGTLKQMDWADKPEPTDQPNTY